MKLLRVGVGEAERAIAPMSAPAANAFSLPVITMQPMPSSASKAFSACAELVHQRVVQRVELLRPVQRDEAGLRAPSPRVSVRIDW